MKKNIVLFSIIIITQLYSSTIDTIKQEICEWHSWSGASCSPERIFYPETVQEVRKIIENANVKNIPIRFIGSGHSINELVCTNGYLINTDNFNKILEVDQNTKTVRVEGGIKLKDLFKQLAKKYNLALENQGFIKEQSIAGALATGTHGTGKTGTLSDFIKSIELFDGNGVYHIISANSNPEWLEAARLNLGALGFVYAVTLQCVPLFVLTHQRILKSWCNVLEHFEEYYHNNDYFMLMAHPASDQVLVYTWNKTEKKPTNNFFIRLSEKLFMNEVTNYLTLKAAYFAPGITNDFIEFLFKAMQQDEHRALSYKTLSPISNPHEVEDYVEEEIAIPMHHFKEAIHDIFELYKKYEQEDFELVGFMTCRFVKGSKKALLSPAYDQDSVYISLISLNRFSKYKEFYKEFEELMAKYPIARPHWGKYNTLTKEKVAELWGNNLAKFNRVRACLDPHGVFHNSYLCQRLG